MLRGAVIGLLLCFAGLCVLGCGEKDTTAQDEEHGVPLGDTAVTGPDGETIQPSSEFTPEAIIEKAKGSGGAGSQ